jgi:hypothetical protein
MHPSAEELRTFSLGKPSPELLERIELHIQECEECALAVVRLVRESMEQKKPPT